MSLCILCPGQGSQTTDMFDRLRTDPLTRHACTELAAEMGADAFEIAADPTRCFVNAQAQPLICLNQMTAWSALRAAGVDPALVAGYSVGELAAWGVAGGLSASQVLRLANTRAVAMDAAAPAGSGMLAIRGLRLSAIERAALKHGAVLAIIVGDDHGVVAGLSPGLDALSAELETMSSAHVVRLPITVPAHSPWLASAVAPFTEALSKESWASAWCPVLAGIDGLPRDGAPEAISSLSRQLAEPVQWARVLDVALEMGVSHFFELGPGNSLCRMVLERHPRVQARSLSDFSTVAGAAAWLERQAAY
ncbi:MAG: acyltransferase domain-containing protein [Rhodocyclaceae bacterium]|nr:acyltransferase domain-containing protein [Rhodocyclaceae bacterium]